MRIAIDILHPAHVHFFKHFYWEMQSRGHEILITAREKDHATDLLERLNIPFTVISRAATGRLGQGFEFITRTLRFTQLAKQFHADILTGIMGPTIAIAGKLLRRPTYVFYDTEFAKATNRFVYPLATKVITPDCYQGKVGRNHTTYAGYHELAYLHPARFTADPEEVRRCGIDPDEPYSVLRFVGWWATHDRNEKGLTVENKLQLVRRLEAFGRVVISSEAPVPNELQDNLFRGPMEKIHHLLAFANLYFGESATMASEAAVLGTPSIYIATTSRGYIDDQAEYGLVSTFTDRQFNASASLAECRLADPDSSMLAAKSIRKKMLEVKIDVTEFMVGIFERTLSCQQSREHPQNATSEISGIGISAKQNF